MKTFGRVVGGGLKALGIIKAPKKKDTPVPAPGLARRDEIRDNEAVLDELRRRRGGAADIITGSGGAEAGAGGRTLLG